MQTVVGMVSAGMGLAIVPACMENLSRPGVVYRSLDAGGEPIRTHMVWAAQNPSPAADEFVRYVVNEHTEPGANANPTRPVRTSRAPGR